MRKSGTEDSSCGPPAIHNNGNNDQRLLIPARTTILPENWNTPIYHVSLGEVDMTTCFETETGHHVKGLGKGGKSQLRKKKGRKKVTGVK